MSKRKRRKGRGPAQKVGVAGLKALNSLYQRARPQGEEISAERERIEPDRGRRLG